MIYLMALLHSHIDGLRMKIGVARCGQKDGVTFRHCYLMNTLIGIKLILNGLK
jgi:hypothetical protein